MLEEAIPALWSAVHGFFTPTVLFIVLNIVIGTIAVTSKVAGPASAEGDGAAAAAGGGVGSGGELHRRLSRVPSVAFDRLRSFNLSRFAAPAPEPAVAQVMDLGYEQPPAPAAVEKEAAAVEAESEPEHAHMERSRSEAAAEAELPRLPARLHKSASERSAFAHFEAGDAVEARRPATTREGVAPRRSLRVPVVPVVDPEDSEPEAEEEAEEVEEAAAACGEVDARADDFINKFRHQLKLQRIDSILRYRETIRRGQAAAAGGV